MCIVEAASFLGARNRDNFERDRWIFSPAVFGPNFNHEFEQKRRLPFTNIVGSGENYFGTVYKLLLHPGHLVDNRGRKVYIHPDNFQVWITNMIVKTIHYVKFALKVLKTSQGNAEGVDVEVIYKRAQETLRIMKDIGHPHLIKQSRRISNTIADASCFTGRTGGTFGSFGGTTNIRSTRT